MLTISCKDQQFRDIQAIIFDKDGTLADSASFLRELGQKRARMLDAQIPGIGEPLLMAFGIQNNTIDPTGLMAVATRVENEIAAAAYVAETGRGWFESLTIARKAFREADQYLADYAKTSPLFTGSLEILKYLSEAGLKLAILSSDSTPAVNDFVQKHQLSDYIQLTMGADQGLSKPNPELFLKTCQMLAVKPENALMVGDSAFDITMAKNAGAGGVIGICWDKPNLAHLETADVAITTLEEIKII